MGTRGKFVRVEFYSADCSAASVPVILYDENGAVVTLGSNEQLLIDSLCLFAVAAVTSAQVLEDRDADGDYDAGCLIAGFGNGSSVFEGGPEGFALKKGFIPEVKAAAAGIVMVSGSAHIIEGSTAGVKPSWKLD